MAEPYNPLAKSNLGESVAGALLSTRVRPMSDLADLVGAGVYAIYYTGDFPHYAPITARNVRNLFEQPIYVGKAVPKGGRKGGLTSDAGTGTALRDRLNHHANSIKDVSNLTFEAFHYRALTVDDIWIPLGENVLIEKFQPLWNRVVDGFGNKTPGKGRDTSKRSSWDTLHPGRYSHLNLQPNDKSPDEIIQRIAKFLAGELPESQQVPPDSEEDDPQASLL